ncbi:MAG: MFS transporter [Pseudomonadota bacterium]|nr:MFS transporter [Pseudomonadota bacterium]
MSNKLIYYMIGQGSWFLSQGLQMVLFPTILVLMLNVSPAFYGLAQVSILAPSIFLIVLGGTIADRVDTRIMLGMIHLLATFPLFLIYFGINYNFLTYQIMILYGLASGIAQAFALPARDSLLNKVADGNIQRTVITAMLIQFICQLTGMSMGGLADNWGIIPLVITQILALLIGGFYAFKLPKKENTSKLPSINEVIKEIKEGFVEVKNSKEIFPVTVAMAIVGICYMGNNLVALPYITTERYGMGSAGFATVTSCFWAGTVFSNLVLIFNQQIKNWGQVMVYALFFGTILIFLVFDIPFWLFCFLVFAWGSGAGVVISISRTITQTFAKESHRGRILSIYSLAIFSAGPLGALICGFIIDNFGIANNVIVTSSAAFIALIMLSLKTEIIKIKAPEELP